MEAVCTSGFGGGNWMTTTGKGLGLFIPCEAGLKTGGGRERHRNTSRSENCAGIRVTQSEWAIVGEALFPIDDTVPVADLKGR